jgi:hypothetical protein
MCTPTQLAAIERIREAASRSTYASTDPEHLAQIVVLSCRVDETGRIRRYVCRNQVDQFTEWILTWPGGWMSHPLPKGAPCVLYQ